MKLEPYSTKTETWMRNFYSSLSEKDSRRYAAIEAQKLGYGGIAYICRVLGCNDGTVRHGISDLEKDLPNKGRIRKSGGGRKAILEMTPELNSLFLDVIKNHTAGSPMNEKIKWTNLTRDKIALRLAEKGYSVSVTIVDQLLEKNNFRQRQAFKSEAGKNVPQRNEQFEKIESLKQEFHKKGNPVMSMDVKKKKK